MATVTKTTKVTGSKTVMVPEVHEIRETKYVLELSEREAIALKHYTGRGYTTNPVEAAVGGVFWALVGAGVAVPTSIEHSDRPWHIDGDFPDGI